MPPMRPQPGRTAVEQVERYPRIGDRAHVPGEPSDLRDAPFDAELPRVRDWAARHVTPHRPDDRRRRRARRAPPGGASLIGRSGHGPNVPAGRVLDAGHPDDRRLCRGPRGGRMMD